MKLFASKESLTHEVMLAVQFSIMGPILLSYTETNVQIVGKLELKITVSVSN